VSKLRLRAYLNRDDGWDGPPQHLRIQRVSEELERGVDGNEEMLMKGVNDGLRRAFRPKTMTAPSPPEIAR